MGLGSRIGPGIDQKIISPFSADDESFLAVYPCSFIIRMTWLILSKYDFTSVLQKNLYSGKVSTISLTAPFKQPCLFR